MRNFIVYALQHNHPLNMKRHLILSILVTVVVIGCSTPQVEIPPQVIRQQAPIYPADLVDRGIDGMVLVGFVVDIQGVPRDPFILQSTRREFEAPAIAAVQEWRFKPATVDGTPVNTRMTVPISFHVEEMAPEKAAEPARTTVTPPAGAGDRASGARGAL